MTLKNKIGWIFLAVAHAIVFSTVSYAGLPETVARVKPSVVGVGTLLQTRRPPASLMGSGFVVADGRHVITNSHVVPESLDESKNESLVVFIGTGNDAIIRRADMIKRDRIHDLALLKVHDFRSPPLTLSKNDEPREGELVAFTGFPIGAILGLYPVTHRGLISAISPVVIPVTSTKNLDAQMIKRLRDPYNVIQLDATAYPGNSGSALYDSETGEVVGVINKVFVQETKEKVLENPSGITYAIPVIHVRNLLIEAGIKID